jgi:uncharacterized protein YaiI (UPF0178 family)
MMVATSSLDSDGGALNSYSVHCHRKSIGGANATRAIMADLRAGMDGIIGGPAPFAKADRSRFLQALDEALVRLG